MTLLRHIERTARRPKENWNWLCVWCNTFIAAQDRYCEQSIVADRSVSTVRMHKECHEALCRDKDHDDEDEVCEHRARGKTYEETEAQALFDVAFCKERDR